MYHTAMIFRRREEVRFAMLLSTPWRFSIACISPRIDDKRPTYLKALSSVSVTDSPMRTCRAMNDPVAWVFDFNHKVPLLA